MEPSGDSGQRLEEQNADRNVDSQGEVYEVSGEDSTGIGLEQPCVLWAGKEFVCILTCPETLWKAEF